MHNRYRSALPSGENRVVKGEVAMLRQAGATVAQFSPSNDETEEMSPVARLGLAVRPTWSGESVGQFGYLLDSFRPDVVHVHNVFPLVSPWVIRTAAAARVPVVQTVHNYRHQCVAGTFYRDGHVCYDCRSQAVPWPGVVHGCYRGSRGESAAMAVSAVVHRSTWKGVARFLAVSRFVADYLVDWGIEVERVVVKPNAVTDPGPPSEPGRGFLCAGRLSPDKGSLTLLDAWEEAKLGVGDGASLVMVGDGPDRALVEERARTLPGVSYRGAVRGAEVGAMLNESAVAVIPSLWHETFGLVAAEAFARGRPVLATARGGLSELVDEKVGWLATPDRTGLASALLEAARTSPGELARLGAAGRRRFEENFTPEAVLDRLLSIYAEVRAEAGR